MKCPLYLYIYIGMNLCRSPRKIVSFLCEPTKKDTIPEISHLVEGLRVPQFQVRSESESPSVCSGPHVNVNMGFVRLVFPVKQEIGIFQGTKLWLSI